MRVWASRDTPFLRTIFRAVFFFSIFKIKYFREYEQFDIVSDDVDVVFFRINDRVMSVNGHSLENVDYGTAVQVLRDSGTVVNLVVKRRIVLSSYPEPLTYKVTLTKSKKKDGKTSFLCNYYNLNESNRWIIIDNVVNDNGKYTKHSIQIGIKSISIIISMI